MPDQSRAEIIEQNPVGNGLEGIRASYRSLCNDKGFPYELDTLDRLDAKDLEELTRTFLFAIQTLPTTNLLPSATRHPTLRNDVQQLELSMSLRPKGFDFNRVKPSLKAALAHELDDTLLWDRVYDAVTETTPPPQAIASFLHQTPRSHNTSSFVNTYEHRKDVDQALKEELGSLYINVPGFHERYFGQVKGLKTASARFFENCSNGSDPPFRDGWTTWPKIASQENVLGWIEEFTDKLATFAQSCNSARAHRRKPLAVPDKPIAGSVGKRKMDIGFVDDTKTGKDPKAGKDLEWNWGDILVTGELKSNPTADTRSETWCDLATYSREVLGKQPTRRFVYGFTLCGSIMRLWRFDRGGTYASKPFDINKNGLLTVSTILGFLWMNDEELGLDPTIRTENGQQFIEFKREQGAGTERLILDEVMKRAYCIAGRATTCWKAHFEDDPDNLFVVKDSWQYLERDDEGELVREATLLGVSHVARYYHHETVQVGDADDDVQNNVRKGLDVTKDSDCRQFRLPLSASTSTAGLSRAGGSSSIAGTKRSSSLSGAPLPPRKRPCSSSTKAGSSVAPNRVHRRLILRDYGIPIYEASSRKVLLTALMDCIEGHRSLREKAGILHRDISIGNLMVGNDNRGFLIDLDLAIKEQRIGISGARGMTGTKAFMAIGALKGVQHSFIHDLESFFWVLFWICIHYDAPSPAHPARGQVTKGYEKWNYEDPDKLANLKKGEISDEGDFIRAAEENFTPHYKPMVAWINRLRRVVFPDGKRLKEEDSSLYSQMLEVLKKARDTDPNM